MQVADIMRRVPITVTSDDDIGLVAERMAWAGIHHIPVLKDGRLVGLVSERDVAIHGARHGHKGLNQTVDTVMRREPRTASPIETVPEIAARMAAEETDCYPVVHRGELVGIVTTTDLLLAHVEPAGTPEAPTAAPLRAPLVGDAMTPNPVTVHADDYLLDAAATLQKRGVRHLPVIDGDRRVVGLLSESDVRAAIGNPARALASGSASIAAHLLRVGAAMTRAPATTTPEQSVHEVALQFVHHSATAVPVVEADGKLVGILSYVDLLRVLSRA